MIRPAFHSNKDRKQMKMRMVFPMVLLTGLDFSVQIVLTKPNLAQPIKTVISLCSFFTSQKVEIAARRQLSRI